MTAFVAAAVIANITDWTGQLMLYSPIVAIASIVLSILVATISAAAGVLISLRSPTVREAQQTLMATIMFPVLILGVVGTFVFTIDNLRETITSTMEKIDPIVLLLAVTIILSVVCYLLVRLAKRRFQRARLITN